MTLVIFGKPFSAGKVSVTGRIFDKEGLNFSMKLTGTQQFSASSETVYNAILNPDVLKAAIPGATNVTYTDPNTLLVELTTPLPGLKGPYGLAVAVANRQPNNKVDLKVQRSGRAGTIDATCSVTITDNAQGAVVAYDLDATLSGVVAIADNIVGKPIVNNALKSFFSNLEKAVK